MSKGIKPIEISPAHWITPPFFSKSGQPGNPEVQRANEEAAKTINETKMLFINACLEQIIGKEEYGMSMLEIVGSDQQLHQNIFSKIDVSKLRLLLRSEFSPVIIVPINPDPNAKKQEGLITQDGHTLTLDYDGKHIGTMSIQYLQGRISISCNIIEDGDEDHGVEFECKTCGKMSDAADTSPQGLCEECSTERKEYEDDQH